MDGDADATSRDDFHLADLLTVDQVVERYPLFHRSELYAAMRSRKLRHWPKGRQRFVTERWLQDWIRSQLRGGEGDAGQKVSEADTGDRRGWRGPTSRRMTPEEEAVAAKLLAQSIMRKPRRDSRKP